MSHHCQAAVITCMDYRLHQRADGRNYIAEFIKNLGVDCDLIARAGAVMDIADGQAGFADSLCRDVNVCASLHQASDVYLINHEDCGAYAGNNFSDRDTEIAKHLEDLKKAKEVIDVKFPGKNVRLYFAELQTGTTDVFEIKEIK